MWHLTLGQIAKQPLRALLLALIMTFLLWCSPVWADWTAPQSFSNAQLKGRDFGQSAGESPL